MTSVSMQLRSVGHINAILKATSQAASLPHILLAIRHPGLWQGDLNALRESRHILLDELLHNDRDFEAIASVSSLKLYSPITI
jgi:hypothetical protein